MVPRVSVVVTAYNLARFLGRAIDSALAQDWPADALEVIVVDDGSTDETPQVLAAYGERIRVIRQANQGLVRAVDRGLAEVSGDYVALLDADDEWPADRLRRQVEHLEAHPRVGLVHGDMTLIDADGAVTAASFFAEQRINPTRGHVLGRLLAGNFVSGGASTFRASLLPAVHPIPDDAAYPDWWIAATIAAVAEVDHLPGCFNLYRFHGANMGLGSGPAEIDAILRREIPWRRWMLRHLLDDPTVSATDLRNAFGSWEHGLVRAALGAGDPPSDVLSVTEEERARGVLAAEQGAAALRAGDPDRATRLLLRALGEDPFNGAARYDLQVALHQAAGCLAPGAAAPAGAARARHPRGRRRPRARPRPARRLRGADDCARRRHARGDLRQRRGARRAGGAGRAPRSRRRGLTGHRRPAGPAHHAGPAAARGARRRSARRAYAGGRGMSPAALLERAEAAFAAGDLVDARNGLEQALAAAADDPALRVQVLNDLAVLAATEGGDAEPLLLAALADDPGYGPALENLGEALRRRRRSRPGLALADTRRAGGAHDDRIAATLAQVTRVRRRDLIVTDEPAGPLPASGRVLIVVDYFHPSVGGSERLAEAAGIALQALGLEVDVATRALPGRGGLEHRGMTVHEIDGDVRARLAQVVEGGGYDALVVFSGPTAWPVVASLQLDRPRPASSSCRASTPTTRPSCARTPACSRPTPGCWPRADVVGVSSYAGYDARLSADLGLTASISPTRSRPCPRRRSRSTRGPARRCCWPSATSVPGEGSRRPAADAARPPGRLAPDHHRRRRSPDAGGRRGGPPPGGRGPPGHALGPGRPESSPRRWTPRTPCCCPLARRRPRSCCSRP